MDEAWVWQGFFGPAATVAAAKLVAEQAAPDVVGVVVPPVGAPAAAVDADGETTMFAVQTRPATPWPVPPGLKAARSEIVGRLVGA